jgi:hypothetical protein
LLFCYHFTIWREVSWLILAVPRAWLTHRRPGVWTCCRPIGTERIVAVNVVGMLGNAAAA